MEIIIGESEAILTVEVSEQEEIGWVYEEEPPFDIGIQDKNQFRSILLLFLLIIFNLLMIIKPEDYDYFGMYISSFTLYIILIFHYIIKSKGLESKYTVFIPKLFKIGKIIFGISGIILIYFLFLIYL